MKQLVLLLAVVLGLSACAQQRGTRFEAARVAELQPGISTEQDAIAKLGPPSSVSNQARGNKLLQWQYVYGTVGNSEGAHAAILFGSDGKMIRVMQLSKL